MNQNDFKSMSTDELWALHEEVAKRLAAALTAEKSLLESRLKLLQRGIEIRPAGKPAVTKLSGRKRLAARSSAAKRSGTKSSRSKSSRTKALRARRPYPVVVPKYRNPERPSETWAGRGKTPRWLTAQLKSGKRIDDFRIRYAA
jgi:DNA-binding protein H-NS